MTKSLDPNGQKKSQPGRVSATSRTRHHTEEDGRKRPQGKSETKQLKGSPAAEPSSGKGHQYKRVSNVEEGGMQVDQHDQTRNRHYTSPQSPSESKNKTSVYPYASRTRDVFTDNPPCVEPSETAPVAVAEIFSQQMRRSSATNNYLRGDLIMFDNIPGESNPKPMSRRNSYSSELSKKCAPMNENLRKNSSGNLTGNSFGSGPLRSNNNLPLRRNSSSTHFSRRKSSSDLIKLSSRAYTSSQNDCWDDSGKQRELLTSLQLQETYRAAAQILGVNNGRQSDDRSSPNHNLEGDNVAVTTETIVPPNTLVGVNHKYKIMPSQERMHSPPVTDTDPVEAATQLIEKYSKESMGNRKADGSPNQARKSPLPKENSMEATSESAKRHSTSVPKAYYGRRDSSATEQLIRKYAKQKRRSSAHQDHRPHDRRYRRPSAYSSKSDPQSRHLKQQQALIKKIRNEVSEGEKRNKKVQSSSSQSSTSNSQSDHLSQCASIEQKSIHDLTKRKNDGGFVEIDLGDANSIDPNIPSTIDINEESTEKETKELKEASKNKNRTGKSKRRSNETKSTADHLYDSVNLDDPLIGVEIPLPIGNRRKEKQKRLTIQRASIKKLTTQKKRKIVVLTFVGFIVVLTTSLLVFFLVPRGGSKFPNSLYFSGIPLTDNVLLYSSKIFFLFILSEKSSSTPPASGIHQNQDLDNSSNGTQLIVPENAAFFDTPLGERAILYGSAVVGIFLPIVNLVICT